MPTTSAVDYWKPLQGRFIVRNLADTTDYYNYNSFTATSATANKALHCRIDLPVTGFGYAELDIEDNDFTLNRNQVTSGARLKIEIGKTSSGLTRVFSGFIRKHGYLVNDGPFAVYRIAAYGSGIRFNERVLDYNVRAATLAQDALTLDINDTNMYANKLLKKAIDTTSVYPLNGSGGSTEEALGYISAANLLTNSDIEDWIPSLKHRFQEISSVARTIEDYTGAVSYVDTNDKVQLKADSNPLIVSRGFMLTNSVNTTNDNADTTAYFVDSWSYEYSFMKDDGYSGRLFATLTGKQPDESTIDNYTTSGRLDTTWRAQKFRPPISKILEFSVVIRSVGDPQSLFTAISPSAYICIDSAGGPASGANTNTVYKAIENTIPQSELNNFIIKFRRTEPPTAALETLDIHTNYWLVMPRHTVYNGTNYVSWMHNNGTTATSATSTSAAGNDPASPGPTWTVNTAGELYGFYIPILATEYEYSDYKAIAKRSLIESPLPSIPTQVDTTVGLSKYLTTLSQYVVLPKITYETRMIIPPDKPIFPGDTVYIVDTKTGLSSNGNRVHSAIVGHISYEMGVSGGEDGGKEQMGQFHIGVTPIGYSKFY